MVLFSVSWGPDTFLVWECEAFFVLRACDEAVRFPKAGIVSVLSD